MKTHLKLNLCVLIMAAIIAASCKGKTGSATTSGSETAAVAKSNSVVDSLNITDPDEKKICALYDECITDYLNQMKAMAADTSKKANAAESAALDKKYQEKVKAIQPQIDDLRKRIAVSPAEAMKYVQFSAYESKRLVAAISLYEKNIFKNYGATNPYAK